MKPSPKSWIPSIPIVLLLAFVIPALAATEITPQEKKLIPLAKKEGAFTFLNANLLDPDMRLMRTAFLKHYGLGEDFKFNFVLKGTGPTVATARQEMKAGKFSFDSVMVAAAGFFAAAAKEGALLPLDSGQWKNHEELARKGGQFFQYPYFLAVLPYTFQPVWNVSCPGMKDVNITSYADIVSPALKGKTIASDVTKSASYSITVMGLMESGFDIMDFWKKLKATDPLVAFRTEAKMQLLINCERSVDTWNVVGRARQAIQKKPELAKSLRWGSYKEGQVLLAQHIAVPKGVPHPNAGKLFVEFLLTKEGTDIAVETELDYTFLKGYTPPESVKPYLLDLNTVKVLGLRDWVAGFEGFKKMRDDWSKIFR